MRRREDRSSEGVPLELLRYRSEDWPEGPQAGYEARDVYTPTGVELPWLDDNNAPDVPFRWEDL